MKRLMVLFGLFLIVVLLVFTGCARKPTEVEAPATSTIGVAPSAPAPMPPREPGMSEDFVVSQDSAKEGMTGDISGAEERMIIRNGDMSLVVKDVVEVRDEIAQIAIGNGGYVVSSWVMGEEEGMRGSISIRVPDEDFEQVLTEIRDLAVRVESESTNSRDVTEEYIDLEARLKNAEATESQYLALLDRADDVEDILKIYDSLSRVRREIEQIKGQMTYLERTSSMSLITAFLQPVVSEKPFVPTGWNFLEVFTSAIRGIVTFGQWLVTLLIWLVILSPIWGTTLGVIIWRVRRKKRVKPESS
jgi:hypothetical protein